MKLKIAVLPGDGIGPEIMKQGGRYGVRLKASAPSIHMIRADIETTVSPIVGNEKQSEDMVNYLLTYDPSLEAQGDGTYDLAGVTPENFATAAWNLLAKSGMSEDNLQALTALLKK